MKTKELVLYYVEFNNLDGKIFLSSFNDEDKDRCRFWWNMDFESKESAMVFLKKWVEDNIDIFTYDMFYTCALTFLPPNAEMKVVNRRIDAIYDDGLTIAGDIMIRTISQPTRITTMVDGKEFYRDEINEAEYPFTFWNKGMFHAHVMKYTTNIYQED